MYAHRNTHYCCFNNYTACKKKYINLYLRVSECLQMTPQNTYLKYTRNLHLVLDSFLNIFLYY